MPKTYPKIVPVLISDEAAEDFLAQDLSTLDFSQFKPLRLDQPTQKRKKRA